METDNGAADLLIVGTGPNTIPLAPAVRKYLNDLGIRLEVQDTRNAAAQFSDAFDHEIGRAFIGLQVDGSIVRDQAWDRYAERYNAWFSTATFPAAVANVYLIDGDGGHLDGVVSIAKAGEA